MEDAKAKACDVDTIGPPASWPAAVEELLAPMYRFIRALAPADVVDDLVQETFAAASRGIGRFDHRCSLWTWLTAIARNKVADYHRASGSRGPVRQSLDSLNSEADRVQQALLSESPLPDEICHRREFQALARAALASLSPDQQECLVGRYYEGLSLDELGRRLGASPALANTRLYRAREALRKAFLGLLTGPDQESSP